MHWRLFPPKKTEWGIQPTVWERKNKELAAHYVTEQFPVVLENWKIGDIHDYITKRAMDFEVIDYIYVVNQSQKLVGVLSVRDIFSHSKKTDVRSVMEKKLVTVGPETHREKIAQLALHHHLRAIPIVKHGKLEGIIRTSTLLALINRRLHENILASSGIHKENLDYDDTMQVPLGKSIIHRIPWLIFGLVGVIIAAGIVNEYEALLDKHLILAFFIPAIVYMSDALGTQNQTLLIRDMAVLGKDLKMMPYVIKTMVIGAIISLILGIMVYFGTILFWHDASAAFVIALAMFATLMLSAFSSIFTTLIFKWLGQDPALGSGPFATIISDLTSIILYFVIVSILLPH